jgi:hypothetical protein
MKLSSKVLVTVAAVLISSVALAEPPVDIATTNWSAKITTGNTLQTILPSLNPPAQSRRSLTMQNNQTSTDNCYVIFGANIASQITPGTTTLSSSITVNGVSVTVQQAAILLTPGLPYQRYYPFVPSDAIYGTCATTGDTLYVDSQ